MCILVMLTCLYLYEIVVSSLLDGWLVRLCHAGFHALAASSFWILLYASKFLPLFLSCILLFSFTTITYLSTFYQPTMPYFSAPTASHTFLPPTCLLSFVYTTFVLPSPYAIILLCTLPPTHMPYLPSPNTRLPSFHLHFLCLPL